MLSADDPILRTENIYAYEFFIQSSLSVGHNVGPDARKIANNKGKDQTLHAPGLLRAPSCYSLRGKCHSKLATNEISIVIEQADLSMALLETPKTCFVASKLNNY